MSTSNTEAQQGQDQIIDPNNDQNNNENEINEMDSDYDPFDEFLKAIREGDFDRFKTLLDQNPDYATKTEVTTYQPPIFAIMGVINEDTCLKMLQYIKEKGADLAERDGLRQNIIFYVARDGKLKVLDYLVEQKIPVVVADSYDQTPLYYSARDGHDQMTAKLIDLGIDPNAVDRNHQPCLFYAAKLGHLSTCQTLIDKGAKHDYTDKNKQNALFWAKKSNNKDLIEYLNQLKQIKKSKTKTPAPVFQYETKLAKRRRETEGDKNSYTALETDENGNKIEVTKDEYEKLKKENPKLSHYIDNPEKIKENHKQAWIKAAKKIVQALWKLRGCYIFHVPVDPEKLNCYDYFDIVKTPMDLGTVKNKLNQNSYVTGDEYMEDMLLIFSNCVTYNGVDSEIGKISSNIESEYKRLVKDNKLKELIDADNLLFKKIEAGEDIGEEEEIEDSSEGKIEDESKASGSGDDEDGDEEEQGDESGSQEDEQSEGAE